MGWNTWLFSFTTILTRTGSFIFYRLDWHSLRILSWERFCIWQILFCFWLNRSFRCLFFLTMHGHHFSLHVSLYFDLRIYFLCQAKNNFNINGSALEQSTTNRSFLCFSRLWSITNTVLDQFIIFIYVFKLGLISTGGH